jgi:di/tripeptidase
MIRKIQNDEHHLFTRDPVRPHIEPSFRVLTPNETYVHTYNGKSIDAVICVAYNDEVPSNEEELRITGSSVATFYTVWSYTKGAGSEIIFRVKEHIEKTKPTVKRFVTLSPCTEMATRFHLKNGATLLNKYKEFQNFEYK